MEKIDCVIVGGGLIGLSIAYDLKLKWPEWEVVVLEKEKFFGEHTSSRNSGVLHSGIYYKENSLKHKMSLRGLELWQEKAPELDIKINHCQKYIVSNDGDAIRDPYQNGLRNGVPCKLLMDIPEEIGCYTPLKHSIKVSSTAIIDVSDFIHKLERKLFNMGVHLLTSSKVYFKEERLIVSGDFIEARYIINAAGLEGVKLRKSLGLYDLEAKFVKGSYLKYLAPFYNKSLIYPLPSKDLNSLGIHTCIYQDGSISFGPNAEDVHEIDYKMSSNIIENFYKEISQTFKGINKEALRLDYCGIRPKLTRQGRLVEDFHVESQKFRNFHYVELLGIESPGLTCCFSLSELVVSKFIL